MLKSSIMTSSTSVKMIGDVKEEEEGEEAEEEVETEK